jgi:hypothetical protein
MLKVMEQKQLVKLLMLKEPLQRQKEIILMLRVIVLKHLVPSLIRRDTFQRRKRNMHMRRDSPPMLLVKHPILKAIVHTLISLPLMPKVTKLLHIIQVLMQKELVILIIIYQKRICQEKI